MAEYLIEGAGDEVLTEYVFIRAGALSVEFLHSRVV